MSFQEVIGMETLCHHAEISGPSSLPPPLLCSNAASGLCKDRSLFEREKRMNNQIIWK